MLKPLDYENVQANSSYTPLAPGGYVCRIMGIQEAATMNGKPSMHVSLDIAEGPESNRYAKDYRENTDPNKKWGCIYRQTITDNSGATSPYFKGMISAIEESNNMTVQWTENSEVFAAQFKGKLVGVLFRKEEYIKNDGTNAWSTKPFMFMSAQKVRSGDFKAPADKPLEPKPGEYHTPGYTAPSFDQSAVSRYLNTPSAPAAEPVDLPF